MGTDTDKLAGFFKQIVPALTRIARGQSAPLGFNAFALVSDYYYRETFHSDILKEILDPKSAHGEGALFLRLFVDFLAAEAERALREPGTKLSKDVLRKLQTLTIDESTTVEREKGKIDIKITASNGTIVVENKINDAPDMYRQLPKYVEYCRDRDEDVAAVLYLTAAGEKRPDRSTWNRPDDDRMVDPLLLYVSGYSNGVPNLVQGWVERCELAARGFNTRSILDQYAELLRHQSGETMNQVEIKNVLSSMAENRIRYSELLRVLQAMPHTLAMIVAETFRGREAVLQNTDVAYNTVAFLDLHNIHLPNGRRERFAIDVHCEDLKAYGVSFFIRDGNIVSNSAYLALLREFDSDFTENTGWGRLVLSVDSDWAFGHVDQFLAKIGSLLDFLERNRGRLEAICREEASHADA